MKRNRLDIDRLEALSMDKFKALLPVLFLILGAPHVINALVWNTSFRTDMIGDGSFAPMLAFNALMVVFFIALILPHISYSFSIIFGNEPDLWIPIKVASISSLMSSFVLVVVFARTGSLQIHGLGDDLALRIAQVTVILLTFFGALLSASRMWEAQGKYVGRHEERSVLS